MKSILQITILLATALSMACLCPVKAQTRRAVVIGLGEQLDKSWAKINGDKDVPLVVDMLRANGFGDITTLTNAEATKEGITRTLNSLITRAKKSDIVYIHFSGHGQLMTDMNGDETDGFDESWIPYDAYLSYCSDDRGEKHLSDDEIAGFLARLRQRVGPDGTIAVVADACHSGGSTRASAANAGIVVRGADVDFIIPGEKRQVLFTHTEAWLTLSACQDFQLNQEYNGVGKLTHILVNNWRSFAGHSDKAIVKAIDKAYETRKYKGPVAQNPHLSGLTGNVLAKIFTNR